MSIGAKDKEIWHYNWHLVYSPSLDNLKNYPKNNSVYTINKDLPTLDLEQLKNQSNIIIATNKEFDLQTNEVQGFSNKITTINNSLRGGHIFYVYLQDSLDLQVKKQDINWYEGEDNLEISLYTINNTLIANTTIPDDGVIINSPNKSYGYIQETNFNVNNLNHGIYKLEFNDFDGLIREIKINTNKIVFNSVFLADSEVFFNNFQKNTKLFFSTQEPLEIAFKTWHSEGLQDITIIDLKNNTNYTLKLIERVNETFFKPENNEYLIISNKNDIIISGPTYFAFSKEQYFEPFKQKITGIPNEFNYIKNNIDYVVTDYSSPKIIDNWIILETEFNIPKENLVLQNNQLSLVFNIPHLNSEFQNNTLPIDWINITVYKPGALSNK